jgi:type I restriction enzyme S subunit
MNYSLKRFKELAMFINGRAFKPSEWKSNGLPIIRIQNLTDSNKNFNYFDGECENKFIVKKGDLLISWSASLGVYIWNKEDAVLNQHIFKVIVNENLVDKKYFFYATKRILNVMESRVHGATMKHITKDRFEDLKIPLPPLPTQRKIASILSACESAIEKRKYAMRLTDEFLKSAFLKMFGDPIKNPKGWKKGIINDVIKYTEYGTSEKSNNKGAGYPIIGMGNIIYNGELDLTKISYVNLPEQEFNKIKLQQGDIIFNRTNSTELVGKTTYWNHNKDAVIASYLVKIRLKDEFNPIWFSYLMNTMYYKKMFSERCKKSVGQSNISPTLLKQFPIYTPPFDLQLTFSSLVQNVEKMKEKQRESEKELNNLFNSLMQRAFRGELV